MTSKKCHLAKGRCVKPGASFHGTKNFSSRFYLAFPRFPRISKNRLITSLVKRLNQIFWAMEYWFKTLWCQIWSTNTESFFWKSEAKLETLQICSLDIGVSYKTTLRSAKSLYRIFWAMQYWFKTLQCQIWLTNTKIFIC